MSLPRPGVVKPHKPKAYLSRISPWALINCSCSVKLSGNLFCLLQQQAQQQQQIRQQMLLQRQRAPNPTAQPMQQQPPPQQQQQQQQGYDDFTLNDLLS